MSSTNRAFIKAYRQDTADQSPSAKITPSGTASATTSATASAAATATAVRSTTQTRANQQQAGPKLPLSSFINQPRTVEPIVETESDGVLQPGTTVASFQWPKVCRTLNAQRGAELDRVVDLLRTQAGAGHSLIGVMGLFPRVGATTTALCLAARAARRVRKTVLVDANFCHPRIAAWLDAVPTAGWEEVLKHSAPLADAVVRATDERLDLVALGSKPLRDPQPQAAGLQAAMTAGVLRHAYDLAIIDLGTFFDPASQPVVLELIRNMGVDSVVAVAADEPADRRDLATIVEQLDPIGCQLLGTIENRMQKQNEVR
jgi:Mrp family chromosome partitioning ATPase